MPDPTIPSKNRLAAALRVAAVALLLVTGAALRVHAQELDKIVAVVGEDVVLYSDVENQYAYFIASGQADDGTLRLRLGAREIALPQPARGLRAGVAVTLGIRPEHIAPAPDEGDRLDLTVDLVEQLGSEALVYAGHPGLPQITLRLDG